MDKGTGNVKVSRKALFDSNEHGESDNLEPLKSATGGPFDPVLLSTQFQKLQLLYIYL